MHIEVIKSAWRRIKKPSRQTLNSLEAAGAKIDYWPDYQPRRSGSSTAPHQFIARIDRNPHPEAV